MAPPAGSHPSTSLPPAMARAGRRAAQSPISDSRRLASGAFEQARVSLLFGGSGAAHLHRAPPASAPRPCRRRSSVRCSLALRAAWRPVDEARRGIHKKRTPTTAMSRFPVLGGAGLVHPLDWCTPLDDPHGLPLFTHDSACLPTPRLDRSPRRRLPRRAANDVAQQALDAEPRGPEAGARSHFVVGPLATQARRSQNCCGMYTILELSPPGRSTQSPGCAGPGIRRITRHQSVPF